MSLYFDYSFPVKIENKTAYPLLSFFKFSEQWGKNSLWRMAEQEPHQFSILGISEALKHSDKVYLIL